MPLQETADMQSVYVEAEQAFQNSNYAKAHRLFRMAAQQGHPAAQFSLGGMYSIGAGVPLNDELAYHWIRKAAVQGLANAQYHLGLMYTDGVGVGENDRKAIKWLERAASQGHAEAQGLLGANYASGLKIPKDDGKAIYWLCKAASASVANAQLALLNFYPEVSRSDPSYTSQLRAGIIPGALAFLLAAEPFESGSL
jgi:uncharacterized protein